MTSVKRRLLTATVSVALAVPTVGAISAVTAAPASAAEYKVLVVGKTLGFRHSSIDEGTRAVIALGQSNGFTVDVFDPAQTAASIPGGTKLDTTPFTTAANLSQYKTLIFISTVDGTNDLNPARPTLLNATETAALQGYIRGGGGYVGIHAATDTMHTVPWYSQLTGGGARFVDHPAAIQPVLVKTEDNTNPSTQGLPDTWGRTDELYNFSVNPRPSVRVLQTLTEASYNNTNNRMGDDHPINWCQNFEGGKSWYQGQGHTEQSFSDPLFLENMLGGIEWTADQVEGNCTTFKEVRDRITALTSTGTLTSSVSASLLDRLNKADTASRTSEKQALAYLQQFADRVNNQVKTASARTELLGLASDLISWLTAQDAQDKSLLVLTKTLGTGDRHPGTQSAGVAAVQSLADQLGFDVDFTSDAGRFTDASLAKFDAVMFLNTAGDVLSDAQQSAFERYIRAGGGFVGTHSAIETEPDWTFLTDLIGTRASSEMPVQNATVQVLDRALAAGGGTPERWVRNGTRADAYYNFAANVRGKQHVVAVLDTINAGTPARPGVTGSTMGSDQPVTWCQDYQGGRSFYTGLGHTAASFSDPSLRAQLGGAITWAAGGSGDCGATVLKNFQMTTLASNQSDPTQLGEPIGFDVLPDRRVLETSRVNGQGNGQVRLIDPDKGTNQVIANIPVYSNSEDGLYGPAIDNNFAQNKWVYLYYAPVVMEGVSEYTGKPFGDPVTRTTPAGNAPTTAPTMADYDIWRGYFQLSRFKFVEGSGATAPKLDLATEQKIIKVEVDRGACCHVAGDIDFDKSNNLWWVTGDDTAAGSGNAGGFGQYSDMTLTESETVRTLNATGGTFTITFNGQTTAPIAYNATGAVVQAALEALSNVEPGDVAVTGGNASTGNLTIQFLGQYYQVNVDQVTTNASGLTGGTTAPTAPVATTLQGGWIYGPSTDARRSALNTNDLRGKLNRIKVNDDGSYSIPAGNLFAPGTAKTRPEIYAMGFRNPFRLQVDDQGLAYVTDYSPDSRTPQNFRGPAGTGRVEVVKRPVNYGWPLCYSPTLPYYRWNFNTSTPLDNPPQPYECGNTTRGPQNVSRWNTGLEFSPRITQPDIWYSYDDNRATNPLGTPCFAYYNGSGTTQCPQLFPELGPGGGVGPQGAAPYVWDPAVTNPTKFPQYFDNGFILGEFTRDYLRDVKLDSNGNYLKMTQTLNCGETATPAQPFLCDNPMDMQFGPDGNLYVLTYGDGFFRPNPDAKLVRFEYIKDQVAAPTAVISATPTSGPAPLTVNFSSAGSTDPNGGALTYAWDFDGNGTVDSTVANPTFVYTTNGTRTARLTVTNATGQTASATTTITVGNTAPTVTITTPVNGGFFSFGDRIPWTVTVTDPETGVIDCSKVNMTFVIGHDLHGHAETTVTGCSGVYQTDPEGATHAGGHLFGAFSASYTDPGGLTGIGQVSMQQRFQEAETWESNGTNVSFVNDPSPIGLSQNTQVAGIDPGDWLALDPVNFAGIDSVDLRVAGGSAALAGTVRANIEVRLDSPTGTLAGTIPVLNAANTAYNTQNVALPAALRTAGTHKIYLVFRATGATGQPTAGLFSLNWLRLNGQGVSAS